MSHFTQTYIRGAVYDIAVMLQTVATVDDLKAISERVDSHLANLTEHTPKFFDKTEPMISVDASEQEFDILDDIDIEDEGNIISDYFDDDDILDIIG